MLLAAGVLAATGVAGRAKADTEPVTPPVEGAASLKIALERLAHEKGFVLELRKDFTNSSGDLGFDPSDASGLPLDRLLRNYNYVIVQSKAGSIEKVVVLGPAFGSRRAKATGAAPERPADATEGGMP